MKNLLLSLTFFLVASLAAQQSNELLNNYRQHYLPEKVFVHTDKSIYATGETIWLAGYVIDGQTHLPGSLSKLLRVELRNSLGEVVLRQNLYTNTDGHTAGDLRLPTALLPGRYQLVAYTNYQRNSGEAYIFRKPIRILRGLRPTTSEEVQAERRNLTQLSNADLDQLNQPLVDLKFFPEGGDCIAGLPCRVAVMAQNSSGEPLKIDGYLTDISAAPLTIFQTNDYGVGTFTYTPQNGQEFLAIVKTTDQRFILPEPLTEGIHLNAINRPDEIQLRIQGNGPNGLQGAKLLIHLRGLLLMEQRLQTANQTALLKLPKRELPVGVLVATVFDSWGEPMAERLFFNPPSAGSGELQILTDTLVYAPRQTVNMQLRMPNDDVAEDSLALGRISLSVLPVAASGGPAADDIRSWLLLNSDLDKPILGTEEILYRKTARERDRLIEDLLLTRAWRRFRWDTLAQANYQPQHRLETGVFLDGRMGQYESPQRPRPGKVFLSRMQNGYAAETMTDEEGRFFFGPYLVFDTLDVVLQGRFRPGKRNRLNPDITIDDNEYTYLENTGPSVPELRLLPTQEQTNGENASVAAYQELSKQSLTLARSYDSLVIDLDVVDVTAQRIDPVEEDRRQRGYLYGGNPDNRMVLDEVSSITPNTSIFDILRRIPGVTVSGLQGAEQVSMRGLTSILLSNSATFFIDGVEASIEQVRGFPIMQIEYIDVLKGPRAAAYGVRGANGVVLIYTRRGEENDYFGPGVLPAKLYGFHKAREFATFDASQAANRYRQDVRTTLHWNPDLRTSILGSVKEAFLVSDQTGTFIVVAQGLRHDGTPFFGSVEFLVRE